MIKRLICVVAVLCCGDVYAFNDAVTRVQIPLLEPREAAAETAKFWAPNTVVPNDAEQNKRMGRSGPQLIGMKIYRLLEIEGSFLARIDHSILRKLLSERIYVFFRHGPLFKRDVRPNFDIVRRRLAVIFDNNSKADIDRVWLILGKVCFQRELTWCCREVGAVLPLSGEGETFIGVPRGKKGKRHIDYTNPSDDEHKKRPLCHVLLGLQVVPVFGFLIWGLCRLKDALRQTSETERRYALDDVVILLGGGGVIAFCVVYIAVHNPCY